MDNSFIYKVKHIPSAHQIQHASKSGFAHVLTPNLRSFYIGNDHRLNPGSLCGHSYISTRWKI